MWKLINFAVNLMEKENWMLNDPDYIPSQNPMINPSQNADINPDQNATINSSQNPDINWTQNPNWKKNQWELFKETIIWEYLDDNQKDKCLRYLKSI
jgi:hypothetical protein